MENKQGVPTYVLVLLAAVMYFVWKAGKDKGDGEGSGKIVTDCQGLLDDEQASAIAFKLRSILDEWYVTDSDEQRVFELFTKIKDECSYRKVHEAFGTVTHTFPPSGTGDLDYWISERISEDMKVKLRRSGTSF